MYTFPRGRSACARTAPEIRVRLGKTRIVHRGVRMVGRTTPSVKRMNLRTLREVETALVGMVYLMRRAVTTRDDGSYAYAGRAGFALLTRAPSAGAGGT